MSTPRLDRQELIDILSAWKPGQEGIEEVDKKVFEIAHAFEGEWPNILNDDSLIIPLTVIEDLSVLDRMLITHRDAPFLIRFLQTEEGREAEALKARYDWFSDERWYQRRQEILDEFGHPNYYILFGDERDKPL